MQTPNSPNRWLRHSLVCLRGIAGLLLVSVSMVYQHGYAQTLSSWAGMAQPPGGTIRPPDPHGAAGPNGIIQVVNLRVAYWNKAGTLIWGPVALNTFLGSGTVGIADPRAVYDPGSGRFYVIMQENPNASGSFCRVAVSRNSNPTTSTATSWYFYNINMTYVENMISYGGDYPGLAVDGQALYITYNLFTLPINSSSTFHRCLLMMLNKTHLNNGTFGAGSINSIVTYPGAANGFTLQPVSVLGGTTPGNVAYFAETPLVVPGNSVRLWYVSNPLSPTAAGGLAVTVPDHGSYIDGAPQSGTAITVGTLSPRTQGNAFWHGGYVWFCHTAGGGSGSSKVYYYKVRMNGFPALSPTLAESGAINGNPADSSPPSNIWNYQPSIGGNALGDICIVYSQSSPSTFPTIRYITRRSNSAVFEFPVTLRASDSFSNSDRWGDYSSVSADPTDNTLWVTHEWSRSSTQHDWGTWWGQVQPTAISMAAWAAGYNGARNNGDGAVSVAVDTSLGASFGSVYTAGSTTGPWGTDSNIETVKYDPNGDRAWALSYTGPGSANGSVKTDSAKKVAVDSSGNIYVIGSSWSATDADYVILKYTSSGAPSTTWADVGHGVGVRRYNGPGNFGDYPSDMVLKDGYLYVTGDSIGAGTASDYATIKFDAANGNQIWVARYTGVVGTAYDRAKALVVDSSGNVYVTGESDGGLSTYYDYATIKYNSSGVQQWATRYTSGGNGADSARAIGIDSSGNVYVTGTSLAGFQNTDFVTIKYDPSGNQVWLASYDSGVGGFDTAKFLAIDGSGNIYVSGDSEYDFATVKYNSSGSQLWAARYNGPSSDYDEVKSFALDHLGNAYVMGQATGWNIALIKYDANGNQLWNKRYSRGQGAGLTLDGSANAYVVGSELSGASSTSDYITLKFTPNAP